MIFSKVFMDWLAEEGFTDCFLVPGGNAMYLIDAAQQNFKCVPFVHEFGAATAAAYFNESEPSSRKAFVLVTAGPAVTNLVTAVYSAWLEGRELLVVGGQANSFDLAVAGTRQRGFQEAQSIPLLRPITKAAERVTPETSRSRVSELLALGSKRRRGPIFLEVCLDHSRVGLESINASPAELQHEESAYWDVSPQNRSKILDLLLKANRPVIIIGGQVARSDATEIVSQLDALKVPLAVTLNGFDRVSGDYSNYCGSPGWYGSRWSNLIIQQADLVLAFGTKLGVLETGYNWQGYAPLATIVRVDVDAEGRKSGRPEVKVDAIGDPARELRMLTNQLKPQMLEHWDPWRQHIYSVRERFDSVDSANKSSAGYVEFCSFVKAIEAMASDGDAIIPSSSGGAWEGTMRTLSPKRRQIVISDKGLASMGMGLSGAIGVSLAHPEISVFLIEGDGGFAHNIQELGTAKMQTLQLKIFVIDNQGHTSIRANQKANFEGRTIGCDAESGLGLPNWASIAVAYGFSPIEIRDTNLTSSEVRNAVSSKGPEFFIVKVDPEQINFPRISTQVTPEGLAKSNPLHIMSPELSLPEKLQYLPYLQTEG